MMQAPSAHAMANISNAYLDKLSLSVCSRCAGLEESSSDESSDEDDDEDDAGKKKRKKKVNKKGPNPLKAALNAP
jgi:ribosome-binding protein aMBF1 (putative translation factor)